MNVGWRVAVVRETVVLEYLVVQCASRRGGESKRTPFSGSVATSVHHRTTLGKNQFQFQPPFSFFLFSTHLHSDYLFTLFMGY